MKAVRVPPDPAGWEERIVMNMSFRQVAALALGGGGVWAIVVYLPLPSGVKEWLMLPLFLFCGALGWLRVQGLYLEAWLPVLIDYFTRPPNRPWHSQTDEEV